MRLPGPPSHNNSRAEKSFQAFKLSDNKPSMGRRHNLGARRCGKKVILSDHNSQTMISQCKGSTTWYSCNQLAPWHIRDNPRREQQCTVKAQTIRALTVSRIVKWMSNRHSFDWTCCEWYNILLQFGDFVLSTLHSVPVFHVIHRHVNGYWSLKYQFINTSE